MTKRAKIIIAILLIFPLIVTAVLLLSHRKQNKVVAEWGDDLDRVIYKNETYYPVGEVGEHLFMLDDYLGRISDPTDGQPLYTVKNDSTGYLAYAVDGDNWVLLSKTGAPLDGIPTGSAPRRVIFGSYKAETDKLDEIMLVLSLDDITDPEKVTDDDDLPQNLSTKKHKGKYRVFSIWYLYGDSAVAVGSGAKLFYMTETKNWYYVTASDVAEAEKDKNPIYNARPLKDKTAVDTFSRLLKIGSPTGAESENTN